jgi:hypothetical protein
MHDPVALDEIEQRYLRDLWRTAVADTVAERRMDVARFGPVQAAILCEEPEEPLVNVVLGAAATNAVEGGHLTDAIEWIAAHGVDYRVPVTPGRPGSGFGERWLMERGHEQGPTWLKFARDTSVPTGDEPPGVEVFELGDEEEICEGFIQLADESFWGARCLCSFFSDVVQGEEWRCYVAYGEADRYRSSGAVMLIDGDVAELGALVSTGQEDVELEDALLRRCIRDAAVAGCRTIFAEAEASESRDGVSTGAEVLLGTGFGQIFMRTDWRPPRFDKSAERTSSTPFRSADGE